MRNINFALILGFLLWSISTAQITTKGWWQSMRPSTIHFVKSDSLGRTWVGTDIGLYLITSKAVELFNNLNGLSDNDIAATTGDSSRNYAISKSGIIAQWIHSSFLTIHTAFGGQNWTLINNQPILHNNYLLLPFSQGIAFFNIAKNISDISLTNFHGTYSSSHPIQGILFRNDSLWVITDSSIYTIKINTYDIFNSRDSAGNLINIADPYVWQPYRRVHGSPPYRTTWFEGDSLGSDTSTGQFLNNNYNAFSNRAPLLNGIAKTDSSIFGVSNQSLFTSISPFPNDSSNWWLGASNGTLVRCNINQICQTSTLSLLDPVKYYDICIDQNGNPLLRGADTNKIYGDIVMALDRNNGTIQQIYRNPYWFWANEYTDHAIHNTIIRNSDGSIFTGSWGFGLNYSAGGSTFSNHNFGSYFNSTNSCIQSAVGSNYVTINGITQTKNQIWFDYIDGSGTTSSKYGFAVINNDNSISCYPGGIYLPAGIANHGDSILAIGTSNSVDIYNITGTPQLKRSYGASGGEVIHMAWDSRGLLWAMTASQLSVLCNPNLNKSLCLNNLNDTLVSTMSFLGFQSGETFTSLVSDDGGGLWIGTLGDGAYYLAPSAQLSISNLKHYQTKDGLASNDVIKIAAGKGEVWFIHLNGVSRLSTGITSTDQREPKELRPYPNPFRWTRDENLQFANIPDNSSVEMISHNGSILWQAHPSQINGGYVSIDLKATLPDLAPGTYQIVIRTPSGILHRTLAVVR